MYQWSWRHRHKQSELGGAEHLSLSSESRQTATTTYHRNPHYFGAAVLSRIAVNFEVRPAGLPLQRQLTYVDAQV